VRAIPVPSSRGSATGQDSTPTPPTIGGSQNVTNSAGNGITVPTGRGSQHCATNSSPSRLWEIWRELAELDSSEAPSAQAERLLAAALVQLRKRDSRDPEALFARMVSAYIASEHQRGRSLELVFFVRDFPKWAEFVARATGNGAQNPSFQQYPDLDEVRK